MCEGVGMPFRHLPVVVYPPDESGRRRVRAGGDIIGLAHSVRDVAEFLRRAGMDDITVNDVVLSAMIDWRGGGPETWTSPR